MAKKTDQKPECNSKKRGFFRRKAAKRRPLKRPKKSKASKNLITKRQRVKFRNDLNQLLSTIDEIERMHDCYKEGIIDKGKELAGVVSMAEHVKENLDIMKGLQTYSIPLKGKDGWPYAMLDVFNYGLKLFFDIVCLHARVSRFIFKYNESRLKFHVLSAALLSHPLERYIDSKRNSKIEQVLGKARYICREFFVDRDTDFHFEQLKAHRRVLKNLIKKFNFYLDILGETLNQ